MRSRVLTSLCSALVLILLLIGILIAGAPERYAPPYRLSLVDGIRPHGIHESPHRTISMYKADLTLKDAVASVRADLKDQEIYWLSIQPKGPDASYRFLNPAHKDRARAEGIQLFQAANDPRSTMVWILSPYRDSNVLQNWSFPVRRLMKSWTGGQ